MALPHDIDAPDGAWIDGGRGCSIAYQHLLDLMRRLKEFDADGSSGRRYVRVLEERVLSLSLSLCVPDR